MNHVHCGRALCAVFFCLLSVASRAQGISSADQTEWSSFMPAGNQPERAGPVLDQVYQDVRRDGPWSRQSEVALSASERTLLQLLSERNWRDALAWLKQHQPDLNRRDDAGRTPLTMAVQGDQLELVREMIKRGADPDQAGASGMTPLGAAAFFGRETMVRDLLRAGADIDKPNNMGQTALHLACVSGQIRTVAFLLERGADWRLTNKQGRHALAEAAHTGQLPILQLFKARGMDLSTPDFYRLNAVHAAAMGEQRETVAWLRAQGVPVNSVLTQLIIDQLNTERGLVTGP
ncbi:MAG TPA: ankyrin repeat domain-containing protein [Aquabacterium sp.]|uniref:ankyrin repeat domain-containing protein n=1 Tax=Aquabacterium sp. TaxID=1872578 RepID=UPI002E3625CF|nr:ankyrin repeat domain-containing protein [Aquabacterium sp.]HEX5357285.1 ankyrin repeat domain-containing protein [Aquabacterium sp.]